MVGVEDDGNAVEGSDGADEVGGGDGAGHGSLLLLGRVGDALSSEKGGTTLRGLEDDGRLGVARSLEGSDPARMLAPKIRTTASCGMRHTR